MGRFSETQPDHRQSIVETIKTLGKHVLAIYAAENDEGFFKATFQLLQAATRGSVVAASFQRTAWQTGFLIGSDRVHFKSDNLSRCSPAQPNYLDLMARPRTEPLSSEQVLFEDKFSPKSGAWARVPAVGPRHSLGLCFWEGPPCGELDCILWLHRSTLRDEFSAAEMKLLEDLHPMINQARQRLVQLQEERATLRSLEELVRNLPVSAVILDWDLRLVYYNYEGRRAWESWRLAEGAGATTSQPLGLELPVDLMRMCQELKREWQGTIRVAARSGRIKREIRSADRNLRATVTPILPKTGFTSKPSFLIQFASAAGTDAPFVRRQNFAILARLTREERAVAGLVCKGRSNDEIALVLSKSIWTVKRHMYSIFRKLKLKSRTELALRLVGSPIKILLWTICGQFLA